MKDNDLSHFIDSSRFLLNSGLVPDSAKNNLFFYGSIVHKEVSAVDLKIDAEKKLVEYQIYVPARLLKKINKFHKLSGTKSLFGLWRLKNLLKKEGNLDFSELLNGFVKDFCGYKWHATVEVIDVALYKDEIEDEEADGNDQPNNK